jgi:hypothetical protein
MRANSGKIKIGPIAQFILIGVVIGTCLPFVLSLCLFGTTLQSFVAGQPTASGTWSGAPTPEPTRVPGKVQAWTGTAFSSAGGLVYLLWSMLGAFAGEALAVRRWGKQWDGTRMAWLGAVAGSAVFIGVTLCGFLK